MPWGAFLRKEDLRKWFNLSIFNARFDEEYKAGIFFNGYELRVVTWGKLSHSVVSDSSTSIHLQR